MAAAAILPHEEDLDLTHDIPDVMEFVTSEKYLGRPNLYPRQATLLKIIFLQIELFTDYDYRVIQEWEDSYHHTADENGEGNNGIVPGVLERIRINRTCPCGHDRAVHNQWTVIDKENPLAGLECSKCECGRYRGRFWFREVVSVIGRRGSKGHVGALAGAYIIWHYLSHSDPQGFYGVDRDKRLTAIVFAGKKEQAKANQWADLNNVILGAHCFAPYISRPQSESLTIMSRADARRKRDREARGVMSTADIASFEIIPKESTKLAGRGQAAFMQFYDEAAHVVKGAAKNTAEDVYEASTPALDQFGKDGFIYIPSSPWQRIGLLHDKYQQARRMNPDGSPSFPEMLMVQLASWDPYIDWEKAHEIEMKPSHTITESERKEKRVVKVMNEDGEEEERLYFQPLRGAIQEYDDEMRQIERANPETFKVERRSHFAAVMDAYLNPERIAEIWEPWPDPNGEPLRMTDRGKLSTIYRAHGDPSKSGAQFGFAIGHIGGHDERGLPHVVFDILHHWDPADFEDHQIDYDKVGVDLEDYLDRFMPTELTFDQFNSVATIQRLRRHAAKRKYPKRVSIYERPATGPLNWKTYETFKTALGLGLVHAPFYELANLELTFLQDLGGKVDCPTSGPVQTKDVADCMAIVTYELIGEEVASLIGQQLSEVTLRGAGPAGGFDAYKEQRPDEHEALSQFSRRMAQRRYRR